MPGLQVFRNFARRSLAQTAFTAFSSQRSPTQFSRKASSIVRNQLDLSSKEIDSNKQVWSTNPSLALPVVSITLALWVGAIFYMFNKTQSEYIEAVGLTIGDQTLAKLINKRENKLKEIDTRR